MSMTPAAVVKAFLRRSIALVAGAVRVDLDGNPAGTVTEKRAERAAKKLARLRGQKAQLAKLKAKLETGRMK
jgi:sRNA-binding protein